MKQLSRAAAFLAVLFCSGLAAWAAETPRAIIAKAVLTEDAAAKRALIGSLAGQGDEAIPVLLTAWRNDAIFLYVEGGVTTPVLLSSDKDAAGAQAAVRVDDGQPLKNAAGQPLRVVASDFKTA